MRDKIIDVLLSVMFILIVVLIVASVFSITWGAYELHGIHNELQVMNDSIAW